MADRNKWWLILAVLVLSLDAAAQRGQVVAVDPWIREAPPGMHMWAGFVTLRNTSHEAVALTGAESEQFALVEMHRSFIDNGVARMRQQSRIEILPGQQLPLEPGGYHLMLMHAREPVRAGKTFMLTLQFDNGQSLRLPFVVRKP